MTDKPETMEISGLIDKNMIREFLPERAYNAHTGSCGKVLVVAGGAGMTGAAVFTARAALRCGSGMVYVCTNKSNFPVIQIACPEAICIEWEEAINSLEKYDAIAFGPGMGVNASTKRKLKAILLSCDLPIVIDADGLNQIAEDEELQAFLKEYRGETILTPHIVEAKRLVGEPSDQGTEDERLALVVDIVDKYEKTALVKGPGTLVCRVMPEDTDSVEIWQNSTGNPGMATAGSGDVLTGTIVSLLGQGLDAWDAVRTGVYLHGLAGDLAAADKGEYGVIASDIAEQLAYAIKETIGQTR